MLPNYAKWYGFTPPHWPNFPPPLTHVGDWLEAGFNFIVCMLGPE